MQPLSRLYFTSVGGTKPSLAALEKLALFLLVLVFTIKLVLRRAFGDTFINANNAARIRRQSKSSAPLCSVCYSGTVTDSEHNSRICLSLYLSQFLVSEDWGIPQTSDPESQTTYSIPAPYVNNKRNTVPLLLTSRLNGLREKDASSIWLKKKKHEAIIMWCSF